MSCLKLRLMDILACPYDKTFPLELYIIETRYYGERDVKVRTKPLCELYCAREGKKVEELEKQGIEPDCVECLKTEVSEGILYCRKCGRWYPIIDEIPILLPDDLRDKKADLEFLRKHLEVFKSKYGEDKAKAIFYEGKPWSLEQKQG